MTYWILGNPENRRVTLFSEALLANGEQAPRVVSYLDFIAGQELPAVSQEESIVLRIDSPGENAHVREALIRRGLEGGQQETVAAYSADFGRIGFGPAWYKGYAALLGELDVFLQKHPQFSCMNAPGEIAALFDKRVCHARLREQHVPVPKILPPVPHYESLKAEMKNAGRNSVFVKPVHGSSASGVVAFRMQGGRFEAISSAELVTGTGGPALYNSLRIRRYRQENEIAALLNLVLQEEAIVEEWIPKASYGGQVFDLRILVIGGKAMHTVVRRSHSPVTNLHLGNARGLPEDVVARIGQTKMEEARHVAEQAAACFPRALYVAADVLIASDLSSIRILEVNAFGDLLPGILFEGRSTYAAEIRAMTGQQKRKELQGWT